MGDSEMPAVWGPHVSPPPPSHSCLLTASASSPHLFPCLFTSHCPSILPGAAGGQWRRGLRLGEEGSPFPLTPALCPQIRGFTQAIAPDSSDMGDLVAFRFSAFNPILDPWVFILFRKAVFQRLRVWICRLLPVPTGEFSQTTLSQPASGRKESGPPAALGAKEEENWVSLSAWGEGQGPPLPPPAISSVGIPSKVGSASICSLC